MTPPPSSVAAKAAKIRRNRTDWLNHVDAWRVSGLTQQAYCQSEGLCYRQFSCWKGRFNKESTLPSTRAETAFVPVRVSSTTEAASDDAIRIILPNKIEVSLRNRNDASSAVTLIERLAMLSC